jgi:hypothetical protein
MGVPRKFMAGMLGVKAKDFAAGWMEGEARSSALGAPEVVPGSHFSKGSVAFAASQAAVAFRLAQGN